MEFSRWWVQFASSASSSTETDEDVLAKALSVDWVQAKKARAEQLRLHSQSRGPGAEVQQRSSIQIQMHAMDHELENLEAALKGEGRDRTLNKMFEDDYDSNVNHMLDDGEGVAPFGIHGAVRPPMIVTRFEHAHQLMMLDKKRRES